MDEQELARAAQDARDKGYTRERVIDRLKEKLARDYSYLQYRQKSGRGHLSHTHTVAEDALAIALAIELLEEKNNV